MTYGKFLKSLFLAGAALPLLPCSAGAETVRPAVGKYLLLAESDLKAQKYPAALHAVDQAQAVGNLTPYESLVVAQLRGSAAAGAGQYTLAAQSYQTVLEAGAGPRRSRSA